MSELLSVKSKKYRERLRDKVKELEVLLPIDRSALGRKLDSQTVYRLVLAYFRANICLTAVGFGVAKDGGKEDDSGDKGNDEDNTKEHRDANTSSGWSHIEHAVEALEGFLLALTADGSVLYVSENIQSYLGFQQVDIMHRCFYSMVHPADHETLRQTLEEAAPPPGETVPHSQDQDDNENNAAAWRPLTFLCSMRCYHGNTSGYLKMQCTGRTSGLPGVAASRRTACQILVLFCQPFLLSSLQVSGGLRENSFWTKHGLDLTLREVDTKAEVVLGYASSELVGVSLYRLLHPEDLATCRYAHLAFAHSGDVRTVYLRMEAKGGNWVWLQCRGKVISKNGKKFSIVFSHCPIREEDSAYIQQEARHRRRCALADLQNQTFPGCRHPHSPHDVTLQGGLTPDPDHEATSPQPGTLGLSCPSSWHRPVSPHSPLLPSSHSGHKISIKERQAHVKELRRHHQRQQQHQQQQQLAQQQHVQQLQLPYSPNSSVLQAHTPWVAPALQFPGSNLHQSGQASGTETMVLQFPGSNLHQSGQASGTETMVLQFPGSNLHQSGQASGTETMVLQFPGSNLHQSGQASGTETMVLQNPGSQPNCTTPNFFYHASYNPSSPMSDSPWDLPKAQVSSTAGLYPQASSAQPSRPLYPSPAGTQGSWSSPYPSQKPSNRFASLRHKSPPYLDGGPTHTSPVTAPLPPSSTVPWGQQEWPCSVYQGTTGPRFHSPPPYGHSSNMKTSPASFSRTCQAATNQSDQISPRQWMLSSPPPYNGRPRQKMFGQGNGDGLTRDSACSATESMEVKVESESSSSCTSSFQNSPGTAMARPGMFCPKKVMVSGNFTMVTPPSASSAPFQDCFAPNAQDMRPPEWSQSREERLGSTQEVQQCNSPRTWLGFQPNMSSEGQDANSMVAASQNLSQNVHRNRPEDPRYNQPRQWHSNSVNDPYTCPDANQGSMWQNYEASLSDEKTITSTAQEQSKANRICLETSDSGRTSGPGREGSVEGQIPWRGVLQQPGASHVANNASTVCLPWQALPQRPNLPEGSRVPNPACSLSVSDPHVASNGITAQSNFHEQNNPDRQFCMSNQSPTALVGGMQDAYGQPSTNVPLPQRSPQSPFPAFSFSQPLLVTELQQQLPPQDPRAATPLPSFGGFLDMIYRN